MVRSRVSRWFIASLALGLASACPAATDWREAVSWFPDDTQIITAIRKPVTIRAHPKTEQRSETEFFQLVALDHLLSFPQIASQLIGRKPRFVITGIRSWQPSYGLGPERYVGCTILSFSEKVDLRSGDTFTMVKPGSLRDRPGNIQLVLAQPSPGLLFGCTDVESLNQVVLKTASRLLARPGWKAVELSAPFFLLSGYVYNGGQRGPTRKILRVGDPEPIALPPEDALFQVLDLVGYQFVF